MLLEETSRTCYGANYRNYHGEPRLRLRDVEHNKRYPIPLNSEPQVPVSIPHSASALLHTPLTCPPYLYIN